MKPGVTWSGHVAPCCFFTTDVKTRELLDFLGDLSYQIDPTVYSLDEINKSEAFKKIEDSFTNGNAMNQCLAKCNKALPRSDQNKHGTDVITVSLLEDN
jgi:hypothetical protein